MNCPKCGGTEINGDGICLVCGFRSAPAIVPEAPARQETATHGQTGAATSADAEREAELPEWRLELSRRLQELRARRDAVEDGGQEGIPIAPGVERAAAGAVNGAGIGEPLREEKPPAREEVKPAPVRPIVPRKPRRIPRIEPREVRTSEQGAIPANPSPAPTAGPEPVTPNRVPAVVPNPEPAADVVIRPAVPNSGTTAGRDIHHLFDTVRASQLAQTRQQVPIMEKILAPILPPDDSAGDLRLEHRDDKLILLTRTLAGLVDLILVVVSCGASIFAVDILEGITLIDSVSLMYYTMLLLATYFVYSLFFLSTARQTVGMMLTDLRVVGTTVGPPTIAQLLLRCCVFLVGLAAAGVGLLWGCFDRQSRCLHDLASRTRVERISL
jgi:uncharacterized RDD family membrane protein YckC